MTTSKPEQPEHREQSKPDFGGGGVVDRRLGLDKRRVTLVQDGKVVAPTGLERRRGPGRRLSDFTKSAEEGEMTTEQFLFLKAIDAFKTGNRKAFPTWTDVLEVVRRLGYRKTMSSELNLNSRIEDWQEPSDAPSGVDRDEEEAPTRYRKAG